MKAGVATVDITPDRPMWMAGYASRTRPSEGTYHPLFAKALVLEQNGARAAIVTTDLIGFDRATCTLIKTLILQTSGLEPHRVFLSASHTHTGPEVRAASPMYNFNHVDLDYTREVAEKVALVVEEAAGELEEVSAHFTKAPCTLAVNRRLKVEGAVQLRPNPEGPTDPEVVVLTANRSDGAPLAALMCYACHPATLGDYLIGPDYPGYAQDIVEEAFRNCTAMFLQGCGGDQKVRHVDGRGSFRSGPFTAARSIGEELARAVLLAVGGRGQRIEGPLVAALDEVTLPLQAPPTREEAEQWLSDENPWRVGWAKEMLRVIREGGAFRRAETMAVQVLQIGEFALVGLAGEICIGYALRLKRELADRPLIIAGYTNGMVGYIPTAAMIPEGGYEVESSHFYRMVPAPYAPEIEDIIVRKVHAMVGGDLAASVVDTAPL